MLQAVDGDNMLFIVCWIKYMYLAKSDLKIKEGNAWNIKRR